MTVLDSTTHSARLSPAQATLLIHHATLVDHTGSRQGWLALSPESILAVGDGEAVAHDFPMAEILDAGGNLISPGLIDLHTHGGGGGSFHGSEESVRTGLAAAATHGVTRSLLSLVSGSLADLERQSGVIAALAAGAGTGADPTAGILGIHWEGPFVSRLPASAPDAKDLRAPAPEAVRLLLDAAPGVLRYVTLAPELPGGLDAVEALASAGVTVGIGHSDAGYSTVTRAFEAGASVLTHSSHATYRAPGPVLAALDADATIELILDDAGRKDSAARMLARLAPGRISLVSDSVPATGRPPAPDTYRLGSLEPGLLAGVAKLRRNNRARGSTLTLDAALHNALALGLKLPHAIGAASHVPASALGMTGLFGTLAPGYAADVVLWDEDMAPARVWRDGVQVHAA